MFSLKGKRALIVGIANDQSIAWGCAKAFHSLGADLAITYLNEKAERFVRPLAEKVDASIVEQLDVQYDHELEKVFNRIEKEWGGLDILVHSIAFCPKDDLHGRVIDSSREGFSVAMDISVHSFLPMIRYAEPLMPQVDTCMAVTYYGAEKVIKHYNMMGPVKAALEMATRYAAVELGPKGISVHALSPGPIKTRAASGIDHFDELMEKAAETAPTHHLATIEDVGAYAAFLASGAAINVTGGIHHIDGGYHILG